MDFIMDLVSKANEVVGFFGAIAAAAAWLRLKAFDRLNESVKVSLKLSSSEEEFILPLKMKRGDVSRAELLGRLAMFVKGGGRMNLSAFSDPALLQAIVNVVDGKTSTLAIACSDEELQQFNL